MSDISFPPHFRVNHPHIIHEIIEGEAILINLETGSYYSTDQVGAVVWDWLEKGASVAHILKHITNTYAGDTREMETSLRALLRQFQDERLIIADDSAAKNDAAFQSRSSSEKIPFVAPVLRKYTEMEDLLLLDPIHDVDATGWPQRAAGSNSP